MGRPPDTSRTPRGGSQGTGPTAPGDDHVRELLDGSPSAVVAFDEQHRIDYVNSRLLDLFGYRREELLGAPYEVLVPERLRGVLRRRVERYLDQPEPRPVDSRPDFTALRSDGTEFPMQYSATPIRYPHGLWVVVAIFDVSEKRAAAARISSLGRSYLTLARMNEAVVRARDADALFADTCRVAVEEGGFLGAWVGRVGAGRRVRPLAMAGPLDDYINSLAISTDPEAPTGRGPTAVALREGRTVYSLEFRTDPVTAPWHAAAAEHGIAASVSLPLRSEGRTVAVLSLYADQPGAFDEDAGQLLEGLAQNVSFALDGFENQRRLEHVAAQRRVLLDRLVTAQETERQRIAADIHDESVQALAAVDLRLGLVQRQAAQAAPQLGESIVEIRKVLASATESLRQLLFNLETPEADAGIEAGVRAAADHVFVDDDVRWHVEVEEAPLSEAQLGQALRITKEALINVRKHAGASHVRVSVRPSGEGAEFRVTDDGAGLGDETPERLKGHRGLLTMRERAEMAGGWFRVGAASGGGTEVAFWLPATGREDGLSL